MKTREQKKYEKAMKAITFLLEQGVEVAMRNPQDGTWTKFYLGEEKSEHQPLEY